MHAGRHLIVTSKLRKMPLRLPLAFNDKSSNIYWMVSTFSKFYGKIFHVIYILVAFPSLLNFFFVLNRDFDLKVEHQNSFSRQNFNVENNCLLFVLKVYCCYSKSVYLNQTHSRHLFIFAKKVLASIVLCGLFKKIP